MTRSPILRWLLSPPALVFQLGVGLRGLAYRWGILKTRRLGGIVISVGNLTVGGTGKTPMVMWLAERLLAEGKQAGILTRGYRGGSAKNPGSPTSDEVALLRGRLERGAMLGVGADRFEKGKMLERHGVEWFLLDDGFQHWRLARNVDIVLIDSSDPFGGGMLLPAGRLREPRSALRRASVVVITRTDRAPAIEAVMKRYTAAPIFYAQAELRGIFDSRDDFRKPTFVDCRAMPLFAFCAIGNPQAFVDDLRRWGFRIVGEEAFPDHHRFTESDTARLKSRAQGVGAEGFVCTEKDFWNGAPICAGSLPVMVCRTDLRVAEGDRFWETVRTLALRGHENWAR